MTRGTIAIVVTAVAAGLLPLPAGVVERWYSTFLYPALQRVLTPLSNLVPFALFDVLLALAVCATAIVAYRCVRRCGWLKGALRFARLALVSTAAIYLVVLATGV